MSYTNITSPYKIVTRLANGNNNVTLSTKTGLVLNFYFFWNRQNNSITFDLTSPSISGPIQNVLFNLTPNMIYPFQSSIGTLFVSGSFPTIDTIDKSAILYFEEAI